MEGRTAPHTHTHSASSSLLSNLKMEVSLALGNTKPWGDLLYEEEQNRKLALLQMPEPEWLACINAYFNRLRGNGVALFSALAWAQQVSAERVAFQAPVAARVVDEDVRNWRVWTDMVEEPEKYGADIGEWIALDEEVRRGPKRWRVDAFWNTLTRRVEEEQALAVTKIQALWRGVKSRAALKSCDHCDAPAVQVGEYAGLCPACVEAVKDCLAADEAEFVTRIQSLWRGHVARTVMGERFNCGRCLKHVACPERLEDEDMYVCRECKLEWNELWRKFGEELEAEEETCDDCGEEVVLYGATIGKLYLCGECIHDWDVCDRCDHAKLLGTRCDNHCRECGDDLTGLGGGHGGFCCADCRYDYNRDSWTGAR